MNAAVTEILILLLAVALLVAAAGDIKSRTIPNWLNGAIALAALPFWWVLGLTLWPDIAIQLGVALAVFLLFALAFQLGAMGGGDVKLVSALALWLPPLAVIKLFIIMSLAGGVLTAVMLAQHRLSKSTHILEIPYGVAIAFAGLWLLGEPYLNQFAQ
jgi:prepilin peptidase CpaA